ncbi:MAG TPA: 2-oxoacid:acceptor oxidoreductase subunit alpha [Bacillota bacterium]
MRSELTWMVGGQQGEGIESTGHILSAGLNRLGYHIYGYRTFSSRIKGGHTNFRIRIATRRVLANSDQVDVLIAFDRDSIRRNAEQLADGAVIVYDHGEPEPELPEAGPGTLVVGVPMSRIARELGGVIMKNMVGTGASAALLGLPAESFESMIAERFGGKGEKVVEANLQAFRAGYRGIADQGERFSTLRLTPGDGQRRYMMTGDDAAAFGALVGGCRFISAYPITPATDIMHWLVPRLPRYGGVVVQAEDEIAAITLAIGAGYAGVRAMTSTSGPGFSLMMEALGFAGMIEAPVVIVDVQRAGPSTGMPTKHEQSDLFEMLYGSHGDLPRVVLAPATAEECFYGAAEAFNLAERYQTPVVLAMDLAVGLANQTVEHIAFDRVHIDRGLVASSDQLAPDDADFKRYRFTESGISPRSLPGMTGGLHLATGVEHDETGHITEDRRNRVQMTDKRLRKFRSVELNGTIPPITFDGPEAADVLLLGWGSTYGPLAEARERLEQQGAGVAHGHIRLLEPLPVSALAARISQARRVVVVENSARGQLARLLRQEIGTADKDRLHSMLKYDGSPFLPSEIVRECEAML